MIHRHRWTERSRYYRMDLVKTESIKSGAAFDYFNVTVITFRCERCSALRQRHVEGPLA